MGNLYDLLGKLYADRASSAPAALRARAKKQVRSVTKAKILLVGQSDPRIEITLSPIQEDLASRSR